MKAILVTGGAGFVGSHACKALGRAGYLPVCFDNLEKGHEWAVKWGPLERGDLKNEQDLRRVFEAWRPWAVMHFAVCWRVCSRSDEVLSCKHWRDGKTAERLRGISVSKHRGFELMRLLPFKIRERTGSAPRRGGTA
jgi:NAD-dependent epimerase/dehydratase family protein